MSDAPIPGAYVPDFTAAFHIGGDLESFLARHREIFAVFAQQHSGCRGYGVETAGRRYFLKASVETRTIPGGVPEGHNDRSADDRIQLARMALVLLDTGDLDGRFRDGPAGHAVLEQATQQDRAERYGTVAAFVSAWRRAHNQPTAARLEGGS